MPRAGRVQSPSAVEPGREQPPCFCRVAVPDPVRGLLTPRLSLPLSAPRSHATKSFAARLESPTRNADLIAAGSRRSIRSLDERAADVPLSAVHVRGEQEGEHSGGTGPRARCSPSRSTWPNTNRGRWQCGSLCAAPRQLQSALWVAEHAHRAAVCAARQVRRSRRGGQSQYRGVSDHAIWPLGLPSPRPREVVAHATLSLPQPERVVVGRVRPGGIEGVRIRVVNSGRRAAIVRLATRALKALRASSVPLRPRCARLTALTARVATRSRATIDGQHGSA